LLTALIAFPPQHIRVLPNEDPYSALVIQAVDVTGVNL